MIFGKNCHIPSMPKNCMKSLYRTEINAFEFLVEILGAHQKWRENDFWQKLEDDSVYTLWPEICS